jgi:hypothetical protein
MSLNNVITHRIAGITFRTDANDPLTFLQRGSFSQFLCDDRAPDVRQHFYQTPFDPEITADGSKQAQPLPWRSRLLAILDEAGQVEFVAGKDRAIIRNFSHCELDFFYRAGKKPDHDSLRNLSYLGLSLAPTLRQIFSTFLPVFSAALLHSSGVIRNNLAALFLARSTGGKTTVAQTSPAGSIISDDQIILRENEKKGFEAHGTPFGRITNGPVSAGLGGFFLLEKAKHFELTTLNPTDVLEYLWNDQLIYTYFLPNELRIKAYQMFYSACHQVPCYLMRFPRDHVDWDAIDAAMAK